MDGDTSAKTFEQGANSATKDQEFTSGIHESTNQIVCLVTVMLLCSEADWRLACCWREDYRHRNQHFLQRWCRRFHVQPYVLRLSRRMLPTPHLPPPSSGVQDLLTHGVSSHRHHWRRCPKSWRPLRPGRSHWQKLQGRREDWWYGAGEPRQ